MSNSMIREDFIEKRKRMQFFRLLAYFKPLKALLGVSILLALLINASILIKPYIIKFVIDDLIVGGNYNPVVIRWTGIIFFTVILLGAAFVYAQNYLLTYIGQKIMYNIRNELFSHVQSMSMSFFDKNSSGRILTRITNDIEALNEIFSGVLINLIRDAVMIIGIVGMMFYMNVRLALISICCIPVIALISVIYRKAARENFIKMKGMIARINGFLAENISGMKLVQVFHREKEKYDELLNLDSRYFFASLREVILNGIGRPVVDIINYLTIAIVIWYCAGQILGGVIEIGLLYAFIAYIKQFFEPISEIAEKYTSIQSAAISSERIFEILDNKEHSENLDEGIHVERFKGSIEFKNVWFAYIDQNWVLKDISFKIEPGEVAAFVGATGSGKSTILNLIARFYDIQEGEILVDGINIREYNLKDLRRGIAVVLQDVFLFSGDISSNIRLNNDIITDEAIIQAAEHISANAFIESLPNQYHEEVKERGCTFSAGQRQLLSFVRAVAFNPSILALDEATANIDTETEVMIQNAMTQVCKDRTTLIIAHRLSTIKDADKIIVIHKGRIREMGKHSELISRRGIYSQLYKTQGGVSLKQIQGEGSSV